MNLDTPLSALPGIGYAWVKKLQKLELLKVKDLINHYPFRYDDFSNSTNVMEAKLGERVTLQGEIWEIKSIYTRNRKVMIQAIFNDGTGPIHLTWFNQPWLIKQLKTGDKIQISGKIDKYKSKISIVSPVWEKLAGISIEPTPNKEKSNDTLHTGRLVPVYSETFGLTSKWLRTKIAKVLEEVKQEIIDPLPDQIRGAMLSLQEAICRIHFPADIEQVKQAKERLGFDELFFIQLATQKARLNWKSKTVTEPLKIDLKMIEQFLMQLPFELTSAQVRVIKEIVEDLKDNHPMNRLVQGEVGSGKTVVAAAIAYLVYQNKLKTLVMAPTEILAFQHFNTLSKLLEPLGLTVGIYTGSQKKIGGKTAAEKLSDIVVGTHALISEKLVLDDIGLIIVDEQHRFGVEQRAILRKKARVPHFLTMTATPIPRTVALTLYGDLEVSIIDELPKGRQLVKTHVVPSKKRNDAYKFIEKLVLGQKDQIYIITPLIEQSETMVSAKAAIVEFERLRQKVFPNLKLGLLHGRLSAKEKAEVLEQFKDHKIDILVSTTVVEVGVDVPNATVMVIEGAERFGLAQLHQLRGRVGRGSKQSYCLLFCENEDSNVVSRLKNLERVHNGLELAELDLKIRGSGEIFGTRQAGRFELKVASFADLKLIEKTKYAAQEILEDNPTLDKYPLLSRKLEEFSSGNVMPD